MDDTKLTINLGNREIILIGTAHISKESIDEVQSIIREVKPSQVCVELDEGRYASLTQKENWQKLDMVKVFKEGKGFLLIANLVLSGFQRRMGSETGVKPGEEMKVALETAAELGIPHALCDRDIQTTLRRAWARCSFWNKSKLLASLVSSAFTTEKLSQEEIEKLKKKNELDGMMSELAEFLPGVKEALIDERDRYLAAKIWNSTERISSSESSSIVAVVGAGHLGGIKTHLEKINSKEITSDTGNLEKIPPRSGFSKAIGFIIPAIIIALIAVGFFRGGAEMSLSAIKLWVLWNGSLAAIGSIIALGHPLTILVSFLGAPLTSLTPVIGVGVLTGLVQVSLKRPTVGDIENITEDISSLKGIYRNRISRALLVFFLSSLGSSIGTFVSIPTMANLIAN